MMRQGAYGVLFRDSQILLTQKKSGPYKGLWDLPGGGIEFGEAPEDTVRRELLEETAVLAGGLEFLHISSTTSACDHQGEPYKFHQVGLIYQVLDWVEKPDEIPQEERRWIAPSAIKLEELTPFAKQAVSNLAQLKSWRPRSHIRGKAIGLATHHNWLLVCEVLNDKGDLTGWCPLGGGIEFGKTAEDALRREFLEELGCAVHIAGDPIVGENIFEHHGVKGHEIVFAFPITLDNAEIYAKKRFQISEGRGSVHWVEWLAIDRFEKGECILFPPIIARKIGLI